MPNTIETVAPPSSPPSFLEWLRGKRTNDINLPPETGQVDPRLTAAPEQSPVMQGILQAAQNYKKIQSGDILGDILGKK